MKRILTLSIAIVTSMLIFIGQAADIRYKVSVETNVESENTKAFIESHIKGELRSLQDVDIVAFEDADYFLRIVAIELVSETTGNKTGVTAIACTYFGRAWMSDEIIDSIPNVLDRSILKNQKNHIYSLPGIELLVDNTKELADLCKLLVVEFDNGILEPDRKTRKQTLE